MKKFTLKAAIEFALIALALIAVGWLAHWKITYFLNETMERSVIRHIATYSTSIQRQFERELRDLHLGAYMVESGQLTGDSLIGISTLYGTYSSQSGIVTNIGETIVGVPLDPEDIAIAADVFDDQNVVAYIEGKGLLFAVPIKLGERGTCIFYELYDDDAMSTAFNIVSYDGEGRMTLAYKTGDWSELTGKTNHDDEYDRLYELQDFREAFKREVIDVIETDGRAVSQYEYNGETYLIYGSYVYNKDFVIFGCVVRSAVAVGVDYVHLVMLGVFGLLLLILVVLARYMLQNVENKELQQEKALADRSNQMKSQFLSSMSHEIRTPINAILGMDEMILRESKDANILEYAENLRTAGNNLLGIVNDILDFSKIEAGKMEIIPVDYQLSSVLNDLVNMIQKRAEKKFLNLIVRADQNLPTMLHGDEIRIKQIATNILTNAVKYTERGSVTLTVDFQKLDDDRISLRFEIKDTGIGIKPEDIPKLFSAFERIEEARNRTIEGTGLGMNITQQLLRLMNSKLEVSSVYGKGSTFSFTVEQNVVNWEPLGDFEEAFRNSLTHRREYHEKFIAPTAKILVVDDTVMNLTVVKGLLKQTMIQITTAESGYECLDLVKDVKYDIIFLDHRMPGLDGIETLKEMRKMTPSLNADTPVIALTANAISGAREEYLAASFSDYLSKPIDSVELETMIAKYLPPEKIKESTAEAPAPKPTKIELPEWLLAIDDIKVEEGIKHCGSAEDYLGALKVFAESIVTNADEIEKYFRAEDWKNYTTKVHALKSTSRVIGASELSDRAKWLEYAGNSGYINEIKESTEDMLTLYRSFAEKLSPLTPKSEVDDADKPLISDDELQEAIETLREISVSFDYDSLQFVLESLDEYRLPDAEAARIKAVKEAAAKLDWEAIQSALQ